MVIAAVCVAGMFTKENGWKIPEELLVEYMNHIPKQEYEQMYAMLQIEASGNNEKRGNRKLSGGVPEIQGTDREIYIRAKLCELQSAFPVSVEQLREHCRYNADHNSYEYEMIYASPYPPFGEVVDYKENADGTFRYLSNSIQQMELELPPIARSQ